MSRNSEKIIEKYPHLTTVALAYYEQVEDPYMQRPFRLPYYIEKLADMYESSSQQFLELMEQIMICRITSAPLMIDGKKFGRLSHVEIATSPENIKFDRSDEDDECPPQIE